MYYICEWFDNYIVFNESKNKLSVTSGKSIKEAIKEYNKNTWNIRTQPERNIHISNSILYDECTQHLVYFKTDNLDIDYVIETYPEFFI